MSSFQMSIENLFNRSCSFCGNCEHDIRVCNSPLIQDIDRRLSEGYYAVTQQGELLRTREEDIKERFIIWAMDLFHLKDLRVFVVTTSGSPPSGTNKRQYAEEVWNIYKAITATATTLLPEELTNTNTLINSSTTLTDWTRMSSPTSPYLFKEATLENINIIKNLLKENPYAMFLRKVDRAFPDAALKEIMENNFSNANLQLHNKATQKKEVVIQKKEVVIQSNYWIIICVFLVVCFLDYLLY